MEHAFNNHFFKYHIWKPSLRPQKSNRFNNNIAHASRFFVHFFAATARLRRETAQFHVLWRTKTEDNNFLFLFLNPRRHCYLRSPFFGRARERGVQFRHVVYEVWFVNCLFSSFQTWYLQK